MPDERLDSMRQGIGAPPESPEAQSADRERREENLRHPLEMESAMGGTSDADRPGDEAAFGAEQHVGLADDRTVGAGTDDPGGAEGPDERTLRETREAGLRAEGGGSADEDDIRRASGAEGG